MVKWWFVLFLKCLLWHWAACWARSAWANKELACFAFVLIVSSSTPSLIPIFPKTAFDSAPANSWPQTFPWRQRRRRWEEQPTPAKHALRGSEPERGSTNSAVLPSFFPPSEKTDQYAWDTSGSQKAESSHTHTVQLCILASPATQLHPCCPRSCLRACEYTQIECTDSRDASLHRLFMKTSKPDWNSLLTHNISRSFFSFVPLHWDCLTACTRKKADTAEG